MFAVQFVFVFCCIFFVLIVKLPQLFAHDEHNQHTKQALKDTIDDIMRFLLLDVDQYFGKNYIAVDREGQRIEEVNDQERFAKDST